MMKNAEPLVSIVVVTYNSAQFVEATLESARAQTYAHVELIVSDDGSTDGTLAICNDWIARHGERFVRTAVLTVPKNTGIPANCNRGVQATHGEWVKLIAGDDILHEDCLTLNIDFCRSKGFREMIVISNMIRFADGSDHRQGNLVTPNNVYVLREDAAHALQQDYVIKDYLGNTPALFFAKSILIDVPFDESIPYMEDRPFAINATQKGYRFFYLDAATVHYRISSSSVFASKSQKVIFNDFYIKRRPFVVKYIYPNVSSLERIVTDMEFYRLKALDRMGLNRNNFVCKSINYVSYRLVPWYYFKKAQLWVQFHRRKH